MPDTIRITVKTLRPSEHVLDLASSVRVGRREGCAEERRSVVPTPCGFFSAPCPRLRTQTHAVESAHALEGLAQGGRGNSFLHSLPARVAALRSRCRPLPSSTLLQTTIAALKDLLADPTSTPAPSQRMIYRGRELADTSTLAAAGVGDGHTLHLVQRQAAGSQPGDGLAVPVAYLATGG